ncbi:MULTISPECIES: zinc-dependent metalloprotease [unclassified Arthrobacter]|uniref:zinc-dependent metalloprotease n=1 Tax=unclassified Arthrobacter TaxID=235627 RepID=UPI001491F93E|nr:zinc-dependent metalloprotease [Arthrobacter sp. AET 35A]MBE0008720.1 zinc-dependent metalloprotease [Arthrobacter sp. AET 35A]NOJ58507.1 zinc-dependent metalloprotease [Arthrobacter sp. 260]NOJ62552.1 zinc-dependent metalloprotease [Arthrobacter sp. 147(2020)]
MTSNPSDPSNDDGDTPKDPLAEMLARLMGGNAQGMDPQELAKAAGLPSDPQAMAMMMQQVQAMFAAQSDGPVNWKLAHEHARRVAASDSDPSVTPQQRRDVDEALKLAEMWLDPVTDFPSTSTLGRAWSRAEWVEATMDTWKRLTEPVAVSIAKALSDAISEQLPEEMKTMMGGASSMLQNLGGAMFGMQLGQAVGGLSKDVVSSTDIGVPLAEGQMALLPANVSAFGEGLDIPEQEVRLFLAVREAAHTRLFTRVPWLSAHLLGAVESYARGIHIDMSRIEEVARDIDPSNPESMQAALSEGVFMPGRTPQQDAALVRLETALALVEGWVDELTAAATANLPSSAALREMVRRRRATGGPAEQAFASLVGLELRPRRLRDAAALWAHLTEERGIEGRDAVWEHPDLLPTAEDLDDPQGFSQRRQLAESSDSEVDAALQRLLDGGFDEAPEADGADPTDKAEPNDNDDDNPEDEKA